jgi:hypothetical protein
MIYKISIRNAEGNVLFYTTKEYTQEGNLITFIDKFGEKQIWNTMNIINIQEVVE